MLSFDILLWFFKGLQGFSFVRSLGPKIVMISKMLKQFLQFLSIILLFVFAYGIANQALMYHNQEINLTLLKNIFFPAYFVIVGEYYQREKLLDGKLNK